MAHDDRDDPETPQSDRAAILARRQQFIALALTGLATTACTPKQKPEEDDKAEGDTQATPEPKPKPPKPEPCLKVADPTTDDGAELPEADETAGDTDEGAEDEQADGADEAEPKPEPKPRPCLRKAKPRPCLKRVAPDPNRDPEGL